MVQKTGYLVVYENKEYKLLIEYLPLPNGGIDVLHVDIEPRPQSQWQQREAERRAAKWKQPKLWDGNL